MKHKKKIIIIGSAVVVIVALLVVVSIFKGKGNKDEDDNKLELVTLEDVNVNEDIANLGEFANLIVHEFEAPIVETDKLYEFEIAIDTEYEERTFLENFEMMDKMIDKFFSEDFDRSFVEAELHISDSDVGTMIPYNDVRTSVAEHNSDRNEYLYGQAESGAYIQIDEAMINVWFSKYSFGTTYPDSNSDYSDVIPYISGKRQIEDADIKLKDGVIRLSELEERAMTFLNKDFIVETVDNIDYCIGDARIITNEIDVGYEGVVFQIRKSYKGIPLEYGSTTASGMYIDTYGHDFANIAYAEGTTPDSLIGFGGVKMDITETKEITEIIELSKAFELLSAAIGENSIYDVYGVELVYREYVAADDKLVRSTEYLKPVWKFITINQNDNKYTLFYVDVVTGEITQRFEYYYGEYDS